MSQRVLTLFKVAEYYNSLSVAIIIMPVPIIGRQAVIIILILKRIKDLFTLRTPKRELSSQLGYIQHMNNLAK